MNVHHYSGCRGGEQAVGKQRGTSGGSNAVCPQWARAPATAGVVATIQRSMSDVCLHVIMCAPGNGAEVDARRGTLAAQPPLAQGYGEIHDVI